MHWRAFTQYWSENAPKQYKDVGIGLEKWPPELLLPCAALCRLLAARSGHGDFAEYHERFKHDDALLTCSCGRRKEPFHLYSCREGRKAAAHPLGQQPVADILSSSVKRPGSLHLQIGWVYLNSILPSVNAIRGLAGWTIRTRQ